MKRPLSIAQTDGDVPDDEPLQRLEQTRQILRLRNEVILQTLSTKPVAFLEDDCADCISAPRPCFCSHTDEVITRHAVNPNRLYEVVTHTVNVLISIHCVAPDRL